jgi:hypothetical protein
MASKTVAMMLCIVGGIFYMIGGLFGGFFIAGYEAYVATRGILTDTVFEQVFWILELSIIVGVVTGAIIIGGVLMHSNNPRRRRLGGVFAIVGMVAGAVNTLGGVLFGIILTILGSIVWLTYKEPQVSISTLPLVSSVSPGMASAPAFTPVVTRVCPSCRSDISQDAKFCPHCGKQFSRLMN